MIAEALQPKNLYKACRKVVANKGSAGVDSMQVDELKAYLDTHRTRIAMDILHRKYLPSTIKGVAIPKGNGKTRMLGIPTVVDRWLQQAVSQQLAKRFELQFEPYSYGFRPKKNIQQAVQQSLKYIPACRPQAGTMVIRIL